MLLSKLTRSKTSMKPIRYQTSVCYTTSSSKIAKYKYGKPITSEKVNFLSTKICKSNHKISQAWLSSSRLDLARKNVASKLRELLHSQKFFRAVRVHVSTFKSEREAQAHMDSAKHVKELESVSLYDTIRLRWAERVTGISNVAQEASAVFAHEESASSKTKASSMGWALKATQKRPRLGEKVKAYLIEKFEAGERSGTKADPLTVSREMKFKRDDKGRQRRTGISA